MTRMIPPTIHSSVQSHAERRIYEVIRDAPDTEHWVCLHSLGLAHHETKRRAEPAVSGIPGAAAVRDRMNHHRFLWVCGVLG